MAELPISELVARAAELRMQLSGRLPERVYWGWKDFLVGTSTMPGAAVGAYVLLLHHQLDKGSLPVDTGELLRIGRIEGTTDVLGHVLGKFQQLGDHFYNVRMLQEFVAAAEQAVRARRNGVRGGRPKNDEPFPS